MATAALLPELLESGRSIEVKDFDDSKIGVKGLIDAGITVIPRFFIHPSENPSNPNPTSSPKDLPVIDLAGIDSDLRPVIVEKIQHASHHWGFFQIINHGIPTVVLEDSISAVRSFHEQPTAWKQQFYTRDRTGFCFCSTFDLTYSTVAGWKDSLRVRLGRDGVDSGEIPAICRENIVAWDEHVVGLANALMGLLSEGLGVEPSYLKDMTCLENRTLMGHYYPYCPEAELSMGLSGHTDPVLLTVLLQNRIGGLQVRHDGEWVEIKPLAGALVVNIGDFFQIISNNRYKSVEHRVTANSSREPRISLAVFFNPSKTGECDYYGPLPELLSPENPPLYRNFTLPEYRGWVFGKKTHGTVIDNARL